MKSRGQNQVPSATRKKQKHQNRALLARKLAPSAYDDPEYQARKSGTRDLSHHDAVFECAFLSAQYRDMWRSMAKTKPNLKKILRALRDRRVPFVLTGAHGIASWTGRPRSTHDVDILVKPENQIRAVNAIKRLYPNLEVRKFNNVTAFFVPGETMSVIDISCPIRADNEATLLTGVWVEEENLKYRVPKLEAALANKYGAMLSPTRDHLKRAMDAVDFATMVKHSTKKGRKAIDLEQLAALGELVWPGGGGKEILRLVEQAKAGTVPNVNNGA